MKPIESWLNQVAYSHSDSKSTRYQYKKYMNEFCDFIQMTPEQILAEYENTIDERKFKRKHTQAIKDWQSDLYTNKLENATIRTRIGAIKSFYSYKDLPIGKIPQAKVRVTYHNRDIEQDEIMKIINLSQPREKAFYAVMAQSGLRPCAIQKLKLNMIEDLNKEQKSYMISIPPEIEKGKFGGHPSFIGEDARKYLRTYIATRTGLKPNSLLFCTHNKPDTPLNIKNLSRAFQTQAKRLRKAGELKYETPKERKPAQLRLYTLRKFFKRQSKGIGDEDTNYLMGHIQDNYAPQNPEYYRHRYEESALPFLRLETPTPTDTTKILETIEQTHKKELDTYKTENENLKNRLELTETKIKELKRDLNKGLTTTIQKAIDSMAKNQPPTTNRENELIEQTMKQHDEIKDLREKNAELQEFINNKFQNYMDDRFERWLKEKELEAKNQTKKPTHS